MRTHALVLSLSLFAFSSLAHAELQLITSDEAKLPKATGQIASRGVTRGPGIKVLSPDPAAKLGSGPFDLKIAFEPRGSSKIDPSSVTVTYLKSPAVDLTERVKSGIKPGGIELSKTTVPAGEHPVRVTVKDDEGRQTSLTFNISVAN